MPTSPPPRSAWTTTVWTNPDAQSRQGGFSTGPDGLTVAEIPGTKLAGLMSMSFTLDSLSIPRMDPPRASEGLGDTGAELEEVTVEAEKPETPPCEYGLSTASGAFTGGAYVGPGGEVTTGLDNGHDFVTLRAGFGFGGGGSYNPKGGLPIRPSDHGGGGSIRSVTAKFNFSIGVPFTKISASLTAEFGGAYSGSDGFGWVANLDPEYGALAEKGFRATGSIGGQVSLYGKPAEATTSTGTCRAHY